MVLMRGGGRNIFGDQLGEGSEIMNPGSTRWGHIY